MGDNHLGPCSRQGCERDATHLTAGPDGEPAAWCYEDSRHAITGGPVRVQYEEPAYSRSERAFMATGTLLEVAGWVAGLVTALALLGSLIALAAVTAGADGEWAGWVMLVLLIGAVTTAAAWAGQRALERAFARRYA